MSGQTVVVRKRLPATCEEVFDAWLDAEGMRRWMWRWMCPGPVTGCEVTMETRVGVVAVGRAGDADYDRASGA